MAEAERNVNTPSDDYNKVAPCWALPRTLMGGTKAMRAAGVKYLPMEKNETPDDYRTRLDRTTLFNAFKKTVKDMTGKVFNKEIELGEDVPEQLKTIAENVDQAGRHLNVFARDAFFDCMPVGIGFILTEMPPMLQPGTGTGQNGEVTLADEQKANRRPYLCFIEAENLIGWIFETINGRPTLMQARIRECATVDDGPYHKKKIPQVRVLTPGRWETWRENDKNEWYMHEEGVTSLSYIPLAPVYINRTGFFTGEPPLEDLADLNVSHWQSQSDQRNILHVARVPILFLKGFGEKDSITVGANSAIRSMSTEADVKWVEHNGAAIESGDKDLKNLEFQMQTQGLQLMIDTAGKTATGEVHDDVKENSPLAMMARGLQDAIELSFGFMADYLKLEGQKDKKGGSVTVNTDFGILASAAQDVPNILSAVRDGTLDHETGLLELIRRGFLSPGTVVSKIISKAKIENPPQLDAGPGNGMNLNAGA